MNTFSFYLLLLIFPVLGGFPTTLLSYADMQAQREQRAAGPTLEGDDAEQLLKRNEQKGSVSWIIPVYVVGAVAGCGFLLYKWFELRREKKIYEVLIRGVSDKYNFRPLDCEKVYTAMNGRIPMSVLRGDPTRWDTFLKWFNRLAIFCALTAYPAILQGRYFENRYYAVVARHYAYRMVADILHFLLKKDLFHEFEEIVGRSYEEGTLIEWGFTNDIMEDARIDHRFIDVADVRYFHDVVQEAARGEDTDRLKEFLQQQKQAAQSYRGVIKKKFMEIFPGELLKMLGAMSKFQSSNR